MLLKTKGVLKMITREHFLAVLHGESNEVFSWTMSFFNELLAEKLLGKDCIPSDAIPQKEFNFGASPQADWAVKALYAERAGMPAVPVGWGVGIYFGHGGPGEFREKSISFTENKRLTLYETGVHKEVRYNPHFYHHYNYPLDELTMEMAINLPNPDDPDRYQGLADEVSYHKNRNRMTVTSLNGFFSGIHYFLYSYEKFLMDLLLKPDEVKVLIDRLGEYNLKVAEHLLQAGVDLICCCDDLGSGNSLLMSPELYRRYFRPWHAALAEICHRYGAFLHLHSHGNINLIMKDLYEIGVDILNPLDPYENMDLSELADRYGDRITFAGGLDKFFFDWSPEEQQAFLENLFVKVKKGFFIMDSGGIPENVTREGWKCFEEAKAALKNKYQR